MQRESETNDECWKVERATSDWVRDSMEWKREREMGATARIEEESESGCIHCQTVADSESEREEPR